MSSLSVLILCALSWAVAFLLGWLIRDMRDL